LGVRTRGDYKGQLIVDGLKEAGINFAVGLPNSQIHEVFGLVSKDREIRYVGVSNEGEGEVVAMGFWFGGKKPVLMVATSGLLVSASSLSHL
jgi:sulfopyruvate decarboxylase TPP-binding subunit